MSRPPLYRLQRDELSDFPLYRQLPNGRHFFFIHINKTGGTSLRKAFNMPEESSWHGKYRKHYSYHDLQQCIPKSVLQEALVAAFVRNPWDRLVSLYHYRKQRAQEEVYPNYPATVYATFAHWFEHLMAEQAFVRRNLGPQLTWLPQEDKADVFIGRYEVLNQDTQRLADLLGLGRVKLPKLNVSDRKRNYRAYYNSELRAAVRTLYAMDIERFDYHF